MKQLALDKMNTELSKEHTAALDQIHNWLCEQDDQELFTGIAREDKTLDGSLRYVIGIASKSQINRCSVMTDDEVYGLVSFYFKNEIKVETTQNAKVDYGKAFTPAKKDASIVPPVVKLDKPRPKVEPVVKKAKVQMEMSIFDFLEEEENEDSGTDE